MTEPERVQKVINILSKDFKCLVEDVENGIRIEGRNPFKSTPLYIDALIYPKDGTGWRNGQRTIFGIEFKKDPQKGADIIKHISQAIDYSYTKWKCNGHDLGYLPILLSPHISIDENKYGWDSAFARRLLGHFNIGEIVEEYRYDPNIGRKNTRLSIYMSDTLYWSSANGPSGNAKNRIFQRKVGSR